MSKLKLWTKDFSLIFATMLFVSLVFYLLMTAMTTYAIEQFNASQSQAGLVSGIFVIGGLIARILAGKYMEVIGRKKLLYGSLFLFIIASLLYFPANNLGLLLLVRFIHGSAFGFATTAMPTAIIDIVSVEQRGEGISYFSLSMTMASAIGPFLGIFIMQHADFNMMFAVCTGFSVLSIIIMLFAQIPEVRVTSKQMDAMQEIKGQDLFEKSAIPISIIMLFTGIAFSGILTFLNSYATNINLGAAASFFFVVYAAFILISRPFTGRLLDVKGDNIVMYPALLLFTLSLILLSRAESGFILLLAGALIGLGFGTIMSCAQAIATKKVPQHRIGLATATFLFCLDVGVGVGPFLIGKIIPIVGFRGMYMIMAVVVFLSAFLYYFVHGKKGTGSNQPAYISDQMG
ncbi:MAG TPA: MFS transporter [Patescibacteria group bacterium]|nr:MFS transporter [Patescibacteria group bacterium]